MEWRKMVYMKRALLVGMMVISIHFNTNAQNENLVTEASKDAAYLAPTSKITAKKWILKGGKALIAKDKNDRSFVESLTMGSLLGGLEGAALKQQRAVIKNNYGDENPLPRKGSAGKSSICLGK